MRSATPEQAASKWKSTMRPSVCGYSSATTAAGSTVEYCGRDARDTGGSWACENGPKESTHDSKRGAVPEPELRSNCLSQAILPSNPSLQTVPWDGWPDCIHEKQSQRLQQLRRERDK